MEPPRSALADELLLRLRTLQVECAVLTRAALHSAAPPVALEVEIPLTNRPTSAACRASFKPLSSRLRRYVGTPFFVGYDGDAPEPNPDQVRREAALETRLRLRDHHLRFTPADDEALLAAVRRVHRASRYSEALARYGLKLPAAFLPLGNLSTPTLDPAQLGPRAESQYAEECAFSAASIPRAEWRALRPEQQAALERELAAIAEVPAAKDLDSVVDCDWVRVCHGGFLRPKLAARPADARVRWGSFVRPGLFRGPWSSTERASLLRVAERHGYRDWTAIAAEHVAVVDGVAQGHRGAWDCFREFRRSTHAATIDAQRAQAPKVKAGLVADPDDLADMGLDASSGAARGGASEGGGGGGATPSVGTKWIAEHDARAVLFAHVYGVKQIMTQQSHAIWQRAVSGFPPGYDGETVRRRWRVIQKWTSEYYAAGGGASATPGTEPQRGWVPVEDDCLRLVVLRCQKRAAARPSPADIGEPADLWADVSAAFGGLRTREQCAARWRLLQNAAKAAAAPVAGTNAAALHTGSDAGV